MGTKYKTILMSLGIMTLILFSGCNTNIENRHIIVKINDMNSNVKNYEACYNKAEDICKNTIGCSSFELEELRCDGEYCIC